MGKHALNWLPFTEIKALRLTLTALVALVILIFSVGDQITLEVTPQQWRNLLIIAISTGAKSLFIYYYGLKHLPASHTTLY